MKKLLIASLSLLPMSLLAQKNQDRFLEQLLQENPQQFKHILEKPNKNEVQILYTQIDRDANNKPSFRSFGYRLDPHWYFYPASTVKLPTAILALEKLNDLHIAGLNKDTPLAIDSAFEKQTPVRKDPSSATGLPSIGHYIKKVLLTSDNDAHNRLFEFVGREALNTRLRELGVKDSRIVNRLAIGDKGIWAKHSNPFTFYLNATHTYKQPAAFDANDYPLDLKNTVQGHAYLNAKDELIAEPWSFEGLNAYAIADQQLIMKKLLFPEAFDKAAQFRLKDEDYAFIYKYMSRLPQETDYPVYDTKEFWPTYAKLLFYGRDPQASINPNIRIFNKYGDSYGYNIDNAYIVDFENKVEFLVTVVVQSNENGIYNDGIYEYETVTYPFLRDLGQLLYKHELQRKKKHSPNLSKFKF